MGSRMSVKLCRVSVLLLMGVPGDNLDMTVQIDRIEAAAASGVPRRWRSKHPLDCLHAVS